MKADSECMFGGKIFGSMNQTFQRIFESWFRLTFVNCPYDGSRVEASGGKIGGIKYTR